MKTDEFELKLRSKDKHISILQSQSKESEEYTNNHIVEIEKLSRDRNTKDDIILKLNDEVKHLKTEKINDLQAQKQDYERKIDTYTMVCYNIDLTFDIGI